MQKIPHAVLLAGFLSGAIYVLIVYQILLGVLVLLVPVAILMGVGLRFGASPLTTATMIACAVVLIGANVGALAQFLVMFALPAWIFTRQLMKIRLLPDGGIEYFPVGGAFVAYSLYAFGLMMLMGFFALSIMDAGLLTALQQDMNVASKEMDASMVGVVQAAVQQYPYIIVTVFVWSWGLFIFGAALFTHLVCATFWPVLRQHMKLTPFLPPRWLLMPLMVSGVLAISDGAEVNFIGMSCFLILLLPYFMCGISLVHRDIRRFSQGKLWFWVFYFLLLTGQGYGIIMVTFYGLGCHLLHLYRTGNKKA